LAVCAERRSGQGTVEWIALITLVSLLFAALLWLAGVRLPGAVLARAIAERMVCAIRLTDGCRSDPELYGAYPGEIAERVRANAPRTVYERGMAALPVDFRTCRSPACSDASLEGRVARSLVGRPAVAFTHVIDCREPAAASAAGYDCSGERAGRLYIQYWTYYGDSATYRGVPYLGREGFHRDDWEGYQVRVDRDGRAWARASSHNGYNGADAPAVDWASDAAGKLPGATQVREATEAVGLRPDGGWTESEGTLYVSGGSHAGHASQGSLRRQLAALLARGGMELRRERFRGPFARREARRRERLLARRIEAGLFGPGARYTPRGALKLIPIETLAGRDRHSFAVSPPWLKRVYFDPEFAGTD
jgi:hypothetical protein